MRVGTILTSSSVYGFPNPSVVIIISLVTLSTFLSGVSVRNLIESWLELNEPTQKLKANKVEKLNLGNKLIHQS